MIWALASCNHCGSAYFYLDGFNDIMFMPILHLEDVTSFSFEWRSPVSTKLQNKGWMHNSVGRGHQQPDKFLKVAARRAFWTKCEHVLAGSRQQTHRGCFGSA